MGYIFGHEWRTNSLVQHYQFIGRCFLSIRNSHNDYDSNIATRYCQIQHRWQLRRRIGRNGLEIGTWRCIPTAKASKTICSDCRQWHSNILYGFDNNMYVHHWIRFLYLSHLNMFFSISVVAMLGMLSPSSRGALMTSGIFLYVFMGLIAGYFSARLYKTMKGREWKRGAFLTATLYPGIVFGTCFFLNFFIWDKHSSGAVPFGTMLSLLCLWFGISVPLVYLGYYFGYRKHPYQHPVRTNMIPRQVPTQPWYMNLSLW